MAMQLPPKGMGCCHCEPGTPIDFIETRRGKKLALCLECILRWFPQWTVTQWEARHTQYLDHVAEALKRSLRKQAKEAGEARVAAGI